jgi:hypothetical protein
MDFNGSESGAAGDITVIEADIVDLEDKTQHLTADATNHNIGATTTNTRDIFPILDSSYSQGDTNNRFLNIWTNEVQSSLIETADLDAPSVKPLAIGGVKANKVDIGKTSVRRRHSHGRTYCRCYRCRRSQCLGHLPYSIHGCHIWRYYDVGRRP